MTTALYTGKDRERIRAKCYHLLYPHRNGEGITIGRNKNGDGYIYISAELREKLELTEKSYCYIHQKNSELMMAFTDEVSFPGYRSAHHGKIGIPGRLVQNYLEKGEKKKMFAHLEDGNLFIDLKELKTNHNREVRKENKEKLR